MPQAEVVAPLPTAPIGNNEPVARHPAPLAAPEHETPKTL